MLRKSVEKKTGINQKVDACFSFVLIYKKENFLVSILGGIQNECDN